MDQWLCRRGCLLPKSPRHKIHPHKILSTTESLSWIISKRSSVEKLVSLLCWLGLVIVGSRWVLPSFAGLPCPGNGDDVFLFFLLDDSFKHSSDRSSLFIISCRDCWRSFFDSMSSRILGHCSCTSTAAEHQCVVQTRSPRRLSVN